MIRIFSALLVLLYISGSYGNQVHWFYSPYSQKMQPFSRPLSLSAPIQKPNFVNSGLPTQQQPPITQQRTIVGTVQNPQTQQFSTIQTTQTFTSSQNGQLPVTQTQTRFQTTQNENSLNLDSQQQPILGQNLNNFDQQFQNFQQNIQNTVQKSLQNVVQNSLKSEQEPTIQSAFQRQVQQQKKQQQSQLEQNTLSQQTPIQNAQQPTQIPIQNVQQPMQQNIASQQQIQTPVQQTVQQQQQEFIQQTVQKQQQQINRIPSTQSPLRTLVPTQSAVNTIMPQNSDIAIFARACAGRKAEERVQHPTDPKQFLVCHEAGEPSLMPCPSGLLFNTFTLRCETRPDQPHGCNSNPCKNNGRCEELDLFSYTCVCESGFTGKHCEINDKCSSVSCGGENSQCINLPRGSPSGHYCLCDNRRAFGLDCVSRFEPNPCVSNEANLHFFDTKIATSVFIQCEGHLPHIHFCPPPLVYSHSKQICDWNDA